MNTSERVLLVEDNIASATAVMLTLKKLGHTVDHSETGEEGLFLASSRDYDLILMDLGLPDINGFIVTEKIRQLNHPTRSSVPIIALTSHIDMQAKCLSSGMQGLIPKPLLENQIKRLLSHSSEEIPKNKHKRDSDQLIHAVVNDLKLKRNELIQHHMARDFRALRGVLHHIKGGACYLTEPSLLNALNDLHDTVKNDFQNKERLDLMLSRLLSAIDVFCYEHDTEEEDITLH